jgi:acyl carrier protein
MTTTAQEIRAFIVENFLFGDTNVDLGDDVSLIEADLVDSTGVLELVAYVENHFDVVVNDADIVPANFDSIGRMAAFIDARRSASVAA